MRKLIARVFMASPGGLLAGEGTGYWRYCFGLPIDPEDQKQKLCLYQSAYAHIMGRTAYEAMAGALPTAGHPYSGIMNRFDLRPIPSRARQSRADWVVVTPWLR